MDLVRCDGCEMACQVCQFDEEFFPTERPVVRNCWGCHADFPVSELEWFYYPLDEDGVRPSALYCPGCFDDQASVHPQEWDPPTIDDLILDAYVPF